jgi:uncharacterized protein (UPF0335 family)
MKEKTLTVIVAILAIVTVVQGIQLHFLFTRVERLEQREEVLSECVVQVQKEMISSQLETMSRGLDELENTLRRKGVIISD